MSSSVGRWRVVILVAAVAAAAVWQPVATAQSGSFDDVPENAYYATPVADLAAEGVFTGTGCVAGFCPGDAIDRKTMAVWTVRILDGEDPPAVAESRFSDVDAGSFHAPFIERMAELGVTTGCGDGTGFCPDRTVTRAQMAVFLSRAYSLPEGPDPGFSDVPSDAWYVSEVAKLAASGITVGCGDGSMFCPGRDTTRAQMATFLWRAENPEWRDSPTPEPEPTEPEPDATPEPEPGQEPEPSSRVAAVLALLDALSVAAEQPSGYDRDLFKHWTDEDGDGCDTRREVLLAEAVMAPTQASRCSLSDGEWISRYDGLTEQGSGRGFDVDHLVPLAEAWQSGAHGWTADRREQYANDLGYEHALVAVSARSNRSKGAQDPATWLPPHTDQHCWYAAAWVHVKTRWSLTVDTMETDTLAGILSGCSDDALDVGLPAPVVQEQDSTTAEPATTQPPEPDCHPAYTPCLPNLAGDALNCGDLTADQKPVTVNEIGVDPYRVDRDRDGVGCTS